MKFILYILFSLILFTSCNSGKKGHPIDGESDGLVIDIDNAQKKESLLASSLYKNVKIISLEDKEDILFGNIDKMQVYDNYIFILDEIYSQNMLIYSKDGKFLRKIGQKGIGPGEYISVSDFTIDIKNSDIYLLDHVSQVINKYNIQTGAYISSIKLNKQDYTCISIIFHKGKLYLDAYSDIVDCDFMLQEIDISTGHQTKKWLDPVKYNKGWCYPSPARRGAFMSKNTSNPLFSQQFMQVVLSIDSMKPCLIVKSKEFVTEDDIKQGENAMATGDKQEILIDIMKRKRLFEINELIERPEYILFSINAGFSRKNIHYDKLNKQTSVSDYLIDDILYSKKNMKFNRLNFGCTDNNGVYYSLSTEVLPRMLESIEKNEIKGNDNIQILKILTEDSNPVIFYYEFKN
jgi:hypothetical protein